MCFCCVICFLISRVKGFWFLFGVFVMGGSVFLFWEEVYIGFKIVEALGSLVMVRIRVF